jgi:hypothetical protein
MSQQRPSVAYTDVVDQFLAQLPEVALQLKSMALHDGDEQPGQRLEVC